MILKSTNARQPLLSIRSHEYDRLPLRGGPARKHAFYSRAVRNSKQISEYFDGSNHNTFTDSLLSWSREFALMKYIFNVDHARVLIVSYLRLTQLFLDQALNCDGNEGKEKFDQLVFNQYNSECKRFGVQDFFIVDTLSSLQAY